MWTDSYRDQSQGRHAVADLGKTGFLDQLCTYSRCGQASEPESNRGSTYLQGLIHNWRDSIQLTHWEGLGGVPAGDQQFIEAHASFPCNRQGRGYPWRLQQETHPWGFQLAY